MSSLTEGVLALAFFFLWIMLWDLVSELLYIVDGRLIVMFSNIFQSHGFPHVAGFVRNYGVLRK